jgi:ABC-type antimicrobial peptide transport system permease subunit
VLGIYAVTSRSVASRTRELGIRMALSARRARVMGMVVRQGVLLAGCGVALAAAVMRVRASFLYSVSPLDPAAMLAVALLITTLAALASLAPLHPRRTVDPLVSLRSA